MKIKSTRKGAETQRIHKVYFFCISLRNLRGFASLREDFCFSASSKNLPI
jgi:hypothetical protein